MAKECIHCGKRIGFFQKAVKKVYCSEDCAEAAQREMAGQQREAGAARDDAKCLAAEEAERKLAEEKVAGEHDQLLHSCLKCPKAWQYVAAAEEGGAQTGSCSFVRIEACPNCGANSLMVAPGGSARCLRCKYAK